MELGLSLAEIKSLSLGEMSYLQRAWERKVRREQLTLGHAFGTLINYIGAFLVGEKFKFISGSEIFPDREKENEEIAEPKYSALSASLLGHFKAEEILHNEKQLKEALERIEKYQNV